MEELSQNLEEVLNRSKGCETKWEHEFEDIQKILSAILLGTPAPAAQPVLAAVAASPQQMKKRPKRLSAVTDVDDENDAITRPASASDSVASKEINETIPSGTVAKPAAEPEHTFARPMRAAKLKTENCFKELPMNIKLRRPDNFEDSSRKIKKEQEQRPSQANKSTKSQSETSCANESVASSKKVDESLVVVPEKDAPVVEISEEEDASSGSNEVAKKNSFSEQKLDKLTKNSVVKIKKEKLSLNRALEREKLCQAETSEKIEPTVVPLKLETPSSVEETLQTSSTTENTTATTVKGKRARKKKEFNHRPIKEERLSTEEVVPSPPVSTRTRSGHSVSKSRPDSIYEDAVDNMSPEDVPVKKADETPRPLPKSATVVASETIAANNITMVTACDATFVTNQADGTFAVPAPQTTFVLENNPNATVTLTNNAAKTNGSLGDATFDLRDPPANDSIMTEDDSFDKPLVQSNQLPPPRPPPRPAPKSMKAKSKQHELFNPCIQSPVKMKVEAFEHRAQTATHEARLKTRSRKVKENSEPELPGIRELKNGVSTTPVIGKHLGPALGRFLTPTQQSNVTPLVNNQKKLASSASKIMPFPTSKSASNLKSSNSTSSQSLSRENSEEDLKKGFNKLQQLAEERKKKRELKHQQAAQLREAKEKERADRLQRLMKEREEKNRKKVLEMEQKKRELEEINRNLKQQEERELKQIAACKTKVDAAEALRQERELLDQMKMPKGKMPPPPPKLQNKYNFNMLHSDDSTDEEGKTSYKRPAAPLWSKSSARADCIATQAYLSSDIIDSFFSVQPMTPDLKAIFPNIDPRYLKRNSSAIWQTPPRYSEMPKY